MTDFEGIVPALGQALNKRGYTNLTPVQKAMLAPELETADALVSAQTGSGKTVAFGLAMAPTLLAGAERFQTVEAPLALVVAPTRELALPDQGVPAPPRTRFRSARRSTLPLALSGSVSTATTAAGTM